MATATVLDQINAALRLIGQLAEGEVPSAATSQDALAALNQMLDSWSTERLSVFTTIEQVFTWPAGQATRTLGPTGDFVGQRPVRLDDATYYKDSSGVSFSPTLVNREQYNSISQKNNATTLPTVLFADAGMPDTALTAYPVPSQDLEWHFVSVSPLANGATLASQLVFPPGYLRAFKYNLAVEIAAEFGIEPSATVQRIAMTSKRNLKRINNPMDVMSMPVEILRRGGEYDIYTDRQ